MPKIPYARISRFWGFKDKIKLVSGLNGRAYIVSSGRSLYILKRRPADVACFTMQQDFLSSLFHNGINVSLPVKNPAGLLEVRIGGFVYSLFTYIEGKKADMDISCATPEMAREIGLFTGRLHSALATLNDNAIQRRNLFMTLSTSLRFLTCQRGHLPYLDCERIEEFFGEFFSLYYRLPVQAIHGDYHPGNIIVNSGRVSGVIDFEYSCREVKVFDLSYLISSVLTEFKKMGSPSLALYLIPHLLEGYCLNNTLTTEERESIVYLLGAVLLNQVHFFLVRGYPEEAAFAESILEWVVDNRERINDKVGLTCSHSTSR